MNFRGIFAAAAAVFMLAGTMFAAPDARAQGRGIWEGFHFGGHVTWFDADYGLSQVGAASPLVTIDDSNDGIAGGIVYGTSWQFDRWVIGTDSELTFGNFETGLNVVASGLSAKADVGWISNSRLRAGVLLNPNLLLYGTAGITFSEVEVSGSLIATGSDEEWYFGFVYGGGLEYTSNNRFFARVEYLHTDYGDESFTEVGGGVLKADIDADVVRGAVGYRFDWSPLDLLNGG